MRRPVLLLAVLGAAVALLRRRRAARAERDLWSEATGPVPVRDLR